MRNQTNPVGDAVRARRETLGMSQDALAARAEVSGTTWRKLENDPGSRRRAAVERRIETVLGWPAGALARLAAGDAADTLIDEDAAAPNYTRLTERLDGIERTLADLAAAISHLSALAQKRARGLRR